MRLKIRGFVDSSIKGRPRREHATQLRLRQQYENNRDDRSTNTSLDANEECRIAWKTLKIVLCQASILVYLDFSKPFILYVDDNKKKGFEIAIHQIDKNEIERPILFFSRDLTNVETRY